MSTSASHRDSGHAQLTDPNRPPQDRLRWDEVEPDEAEAPETEPTVEAEPPVEAEPTVEADEAEATEAEPTAEAPATDPGVLLRRAVAGDDRAFARLVEHYDPMLRELTINLLGDPGSMEAVLHDTYVKAYRALPGVGRHVEPAPWLYRIAYLACLVELRRRSRHPGRFRPAQPDATNPPVEQAAPSAFARAFADLSAEHRTAVVLADRAGLHAATIGRVLGQPEAITTAALQRARALLHAALDDDDSPEHEPDA